MRISTRARYALRLMVDLVRHYDGSGPVHLRQIAEDNDLSHGYLEQLMISLRNASLVRGVSGRKGGYVLARPAAEVRLIEIVEAVIGPINIVECVQYPENCGRSPDCDSRPIWVMINCMVKDVLDRYTLAQMADDNWLEKITADLLPMAGKLARPKKISRAKGQVSCKLSGARISSRKRAGSACGWPPADKPPTPKKTTRRKAKKTKK